VAFGIKKSQLITWKKEVAAGEIAFITHFWLDPRFPKDKSVTKVGCSNLEKLTEWGEQYGLKAEWIHEREAYPHFDLIGDKQRMIMMQEGRLNEIAKFL
jgi:hypothetical protein